MKPRDIVQYFEDRGFLANYWYDEEHRGISFGIHKGGRYLSDTLYYTGDPIQFASGMVKRFAERYYQKEGENKMSISIKDAIFNDPATIVFWMDGTKTVVKCQEGDTFDPEKGLAMAIVKKIHGNKGSYCNEIKKWTEKYTDPELCEKNDALRLTTAALKARIAYDKAVKAIVDFNKDSDT